MEQPLSNIPRKPDWLKIRVPGGAEYSRVHNIVREYKLHTICSSGACPNMADCWGRGTATFMILGNICTRSCKFCNVATGKPLPPDPQEPVHVAESVKLMQLKHIVLTSVDRDDLPDQGAHHWAETIKQIKTLNPQTTIEVLIPDFDAKPELISIVVNAQPEVISHNLETVQRLTPLVRSRAKYGTSLEVLKVIAKSGCKAKSGIMVGLGETPDEVYDTMNDLLDAGCQILTIGQYLQPSRQHYPVSEYIPPDQFEEYRMAALHKGFKHAECSPLVRSSYRAEKHVH